MFNADAWVGAAAFVQRVGVRWLAVRFAMLLLLVVMPAVGGVGSTHDSGRRVLWYREVVHDAWVPVVIQQLQHENRELGGGGGRAN